MRSLLVLALAGVAACATVPSARHTAALDSQVVLGSDLGNTLGMSPGDNLYDALVRWNVAYVRPRGVSLYASSQEPIGIYVNGGYSGGVESLRSLPLGHVLSVRRMTASEASVRFGRKHSSGALLVTLRR
jgi:hypothetical protein